MALIKMYANLVKTGRRTIERVPKKFRAQVIELLKKEGYELTKEEK